MALTDTAVRNAKAEDKPRKLADEKGLFLLVTPTGNKSGGKWWRLKYRYAGKEKMLSLGIYPDVPLKLARERRDEARRLLAEGIDPGEHRKIAKAAKLERAANSFEAVAREWYAKYSATWVASHGERIIRRLERDVFPWLGGRATAEIKPPELLAVIRRIEERGALETAHRALQNCGQVFRYAVATGRAERDPSQDLRGALPPVKPVHFPTLTDPKAIGDLLRVVDGYRGGHVVRHALRLAPLVFVRPGELRHAEWADIDLDNAEWRFTVSKTKTQHIVPLSRQAVEILTELQPFTGHGRYVFPSSRGEGKPMSENTVNAALRYLGYNGDTLTGHGFRATARTLLDEVLGFPPHLIEHQLAHAVKDPLGRAYNRTTHLPERRKMMQTWADYLDSLKEGGKVLPFKKPA
jgi:integrase